MLDGVAAVVGNEVILISDVMQQVALYARQNRGTNPQDSKLQRDVLNAIIDEKLVLTRAQGFTTTTYRAEPHVVAPGATDT